MSRKNNSQIHKCNLHPLLKNLVSFILVPLKPVLGIFFSCIIFYIYIFSSSNRLLFFCYSDIFFLLMSAQLNCLLSSRNQSRSSYTPTVGSDSLWEEFSPHQGRLLPLRPVTMPHRSVWEPQAQNNVCLLSLSLTALKRNSACASHSCDPNPWPPYPTDHPNSRTHTPAS